MTLCAPAAPGAFPQPVLMPCLRALEELASPPALASVPPLLPPDPPLELLLDSPPLLLLEPPVDASSSEGLPPELVAAPLLELLLLETPLELAAPLSEPVETTPPEPAGGPLSLLQAATTRRAPQQIAQTKARGFISGPGGAMQPGKKKVTRPHPLRVKVPPVLRSMVGRHREAKS
jgi:hypothetical protein